MPATKDNSQATTFIYSNFYNLYRKSKAEAESHKDMAKGLVLKSHSITQHPSVAEVRVVSREQMEGLNHWSHSQGAHMSTHLRALRESRKRLKFLMNEVDEVLKKS